MGGGRIKTRTAVQATIKYWYKTGCVYTIAALDDKQQATITSRARSPSATDRDSGQPLPAAGGRPRQRPAGRRPPAASRRPPAAGRRPPPAAGRRPPACTCAEACARASVPSSCLPVLPSPALPPCLHPVAFPPPPPCSACPPCPPAPPPLLPPLCCLPSGDRNFYQCNCQ